jgi:hypothetical protein
MKLRLSSSGCETRPARGEPARAGSEPGAGLGNGAGEAEARERVGRGGCGLEIYLIPDAQGSELPEGDDGLSVSMGEEGIVSGGVFDHGTHEEDGPVTREVLASPRGNPVLRRAGDPSPTRRASAGACAVGPEEAPASR